MVSKLLTSLRNFGTGLLLTSLLSCGTGTTSSTDLNSGPSKEDIEAHIIQNYYDWARYSKLEDERGMRSLVAPQSTYDRMTSVCVSMWEDIDFYYEFDSVGIEYTTEQPPKAYVYGNWTIHQWANGSGSSFGGGFSSTSFPADGEFYNSNWVLDTNNGNFGRNWWKH